MIELSGEPLRRGFGGDTLNTAVYLACVLAGGDGRVAYATALGEDPLSAELVAAWAAEGVDTTLVTRVPGRLPGLYLVSTDAAGERHFLYWRGESAARCYLDAAEAPLLQAMYGGALEAVYLSGISLAILPPPARERLYAALDTFRGNGGRVFFDNNYRPQLWTAATAGA